MFNKKLKIIYLILLVDIILTIFFIQTQGYNYNNIIFMLLFKNMILLIFIKTSVLVLIYYINNYTRLLINRYVYIILKIYIILIIYMNICNIF